jgi:hypothetical protein
MVVSGQLHILATIPRENNIQFPLHRRLGGNWSQFGCSGEDNIS